MKSDRFIQSRLEGTWEGVEGNSSYWWEVFYKTSVSVQTWCWEDISQASQTGEEMKLALPAFSYRHTLMKNRQAHRPDGLTSSSQLTLSSSQMGREFSWHRILQNRQHYVTCIWKSNRLHLLIKRQTRVSSPVSVNLLISVVDGKFV